MIGVQHISKPRTLDDLSMIQRIGMDNKCGAMPPDQECEASEAGDLTDASQEARTTCL